MAKKLSPAMFAWAKSNKSKLKNPTPAQKKIFAAYDAMVKAGDKPANPKPRSTPKPKTTPKADAPKTQPKSDNSNGRSRFFRGSSGTRGESRPSNSPGPAVRRKGSTTGASVDPRERSLRKNRADARRSARRNLRVNRRGRRV